MFDIEPLRENASFLADGLVVTLKLTAGAIAIALAVGTAVGLLRTYGGRAVSAVLSLYVDVFRSIPLLVILVWMFFSVPLVFEGVILSPFLAGMIGIGLHTAAYVAEIVRGGLASIRSGQLLAGLALGMSRVAVVRRIVLPQALIRMVPPLGTQVVTVIKDSALASVIAVPEFLRQSQVVASVTFDPFPVFTAAMVIYFLMAFPVARAFESLFKRIAPLGSS